MSQFYQTTSDFGGETDNPCENVTVTSLDGIRKIQFRKSKAIRGKHVILNK